MKTQLLTMSTFALLLFGQSAMALEHVNSENGYDSAFRNGWVETTSSTTNLDMMKASYRSQTATDESRYLDAFSIDYTSKN